MKNHEIKYWLNQAAEHSAPDVLDSILSRCEEEKGWNTSMSENAFQPKPAPRKKNFRRTALALAACLLLAVGIGGAFGYQNYFAVDSVVAFDVNPSIELKVNRQEKVISAEALNSDASKILFGMELKGTDLNVAVNAIVGSMLTNGYLDDIANSILISVENGDAARAEELQRQLVQEINGILGSSNVDASIMSQTLSVSEENEQLAQQYGISTGKVALIQEILAQNSEYTFDTLAPLSIRELNIIAQAREITGVDSSGAVSTKGYISESEAQEAALADAGVDAASVTVQKLVLDWDDGRVVYDVEFYDSQKTYEYEVDATSGQIVKKETEASPLLSSGDLIGLDAARSAAVSDAGVSSPTILKETLDRDDGRNIYEIEFISNNVRYEYDIDASTGAVLTKKSWDVFVPASGSSGGTSAGASGTAVTGDQAKQTALSDAGLSSGEVTFGKVELDWDDGRQKYEIEFYSSTGKYEYDIDASTGAILSKESESFGQPSGGASNGSGTTGGTASAVTEQQAKNTALTDAGVSASSATFLKTKLEYDDGRQKYDLEFVSGNTKYEYDIDASTGAILSKSSEGYATVGGVTGPSSVTSSPAASSSQPSAGQTTGGNSSGAAITEEQARSLAQEKAPNATIVKFEYDWDDGIPTYEGEMREGRLEYEFEIDARNGNFLKWESEYDD